MTAISAAKHEAFAQRFLGSVRPVLLEHSRKESLMGGFTDNYLRVEVAMPPTLDNTIAHLRLDSLKDDGETITASPAQI